MSIPSWTSPRASAMTLPISRLIAWESRSLFWAMSSREAVEDLAALRRGRPAPERKRGLGGADGHRDVGRRALLEATDDVPRVGRVVALEGLGRSSTRTTPRR